MLQICLLLLNWQVFIDWLNVEVRINLSKREEYVILFAFWMSRELLTIRRLKIRRKEKEVHFYSFSLLLTSVWLIVLLCEKLSCRCERHWRSLFLFHHSQIQHQDRTLIHINFSTFDDHDAIWHRDWKEKIEKKDQSREDSKIVKIWKKKKLNLQLKKRWNVKFKTKIEKTIKNVAKTLFVKNENEKRFRIWTKNENFLKNTNNQNFCKEIKKMKNEFKEEIYKRFENI